MNLAGGWIARIPDYLFAANVRAITSLSKLPEAVVGGGMGTGSTVSTIGPWRAAGVLALYSVVFALLAFNIFRKRDVTG